MSLGERSNPVKEEQTMVETNDFRGHRCLQDEHRGASKIRDGVQAEKTVRTTYGMLVGATEMGERLNRKNPPNGKNRAGRWVKCEGSCRDSWEYLESPPDSETRTLDSHTQILRKIFRRYIQNKITHNVSITPNPYAMG